MTDEDNGHPWRMEVTTSDDGATWYTNNLTFPGREAALSYAEDLARRWSMVTRWRAVDNRVPLRQPYVPGSEDGAW